VGKYAVCPVRALRGEVSRDVQGDSGQERTRFKHDGLFEYPAAMGVELVDTDWLAVQAKYVVEESVSVSLWLISALRCSMCHKCKAIPEASFLMRQLWLA